MENSRNEDLASLTAFEADLKAFVEAGKRKDQQSQNDMLRKWLSSDDSRVKLFDRVLESKEAFEKVWDGDQHNDLKNRMLLAWMSDDYYRDKLFKLVNKIGGCLKFPSRDASPRECDGIGYDTRRKPANPNHVTVTLVTDREKIKKILLNNDESKRYSSRVYAELGGGNFMLALDPADTTAHDEQRKAFRHCFPNNPGQLKALSQVACRSAGVLGFRAPEFDLAAFAEQAALRYCQLMMGYALKDFSLLETSLRAAYKALVYQVHGRHFVTDPTVIPEAKAAMGKLLARTSALIDAYAAEDEDDLKGCEDPAFPGGPTPVLKKLGNLHGNLNGEQRAIVAVGAAIGMIGNVQAAVCIAVQGAFADPARLTKAREMVREDVLAGMSLPEWPTETVRYENWKKLIADQLRANPPIPYLPRILVNDRREKTKEFLLALGGGTWPKEEYPGADDPLVWGFPSAAPHNCAGQALAWPLIIEVVRQVMALPGLAQGLDPEDATVKGLKKLRGFQCLSYPFTYRRDRLRAQTSLNVAMRIKAPVKDNVDRVRAVIRAGAPRIEQLLRQARHVHFAWFELIEADTVLVLHTVYDGPFGAYLQHFALQAGDLFDVLFEYIEDPPPMPVGKFPDEFAAHLLRYNRAPAMGYFFSAYPTSEVARIVRDERRGL